MKRISLLVALAATLSLALIAGCAGNAPKPLAPAQIAAIACPQLNLVHTQLVAFNAALEADPATAATASRHRPSSTPSIRS